jgi:hypothetical protein
VVRAPAPVGFRAAELLFPSVCKEMPMIKLRHALLVSTAVVGIAAASVAARAEDAPKPAPAVGSSEWMAGITLGAQVQGGVIFNTSSPRNGLNFGHLFTDRSNQATLNQLALTLARTIDPKTTGFDMGFKFQFLYGSDARYTHYLGVFDQATSRRYQIDVTEANVTMRLPILTEGGIDVKAGLYTTPIGFETIDPATNLFYSHSYIFNFGLPLKHTGIYTVTHVNDVLDIHLGVDTGMNTTFGNRRGDNNSAAAFLGGLGLNLMDGKLTVLALTHIGPENATRAVGSIANHRNRYSNDILITVKPDDKLTLVTELNLIRDDLAKATAGGVAQYVSYAVSDTWTLNARGEIFRDDKGFFVASYPDNLSPLAALAGWTNVGSFTNPRVPNFASRGTTYGAITLGATWKPEMPKPVGALMLRPEIRYDQALTSNRPFSGRSNALTIGADLVISF